MWGDIIASGMAVTQSLPHWGHVKGKETKGTRQENMGKKCSDVNDKSQ